MPYRTLTDALGSTWQVWSVHPEHAGLERTSVAVAPQLARGWLVFERLDAGAVPAAAPAAASSAEKRRLAPVPPDWATAPDQTLRALLAAAAPVRARPRG
jgi:hypothetical protein